MGTIINKLRKVYKRLAKWQNKNWDHYEKDVDYSSSTNQPAKNYWTVRPCSDDLIIMCNYVFKSYQWLRKEKVDCSPKVYLWLKNYKRRVCSNGNKKHMEIKAINFILFKLIKFIQLYYQFNIVHKIMFIWHTLHRKWNVLCGLLSKFPQRPLICWLVLRPESLTVTYHVLPESQRTCTIPYCR